MNKLNIFYEEPNSDRWVKFDRYPRALIRRLIRGPAPIGGVKKWFINLIKGLDELNIPYDINNYTALRKNKEAWALVVGKNQVLNKIPSHTKIIYGPGIVSHPLDIKNWTEMKNIKHIFAPCLWMKEMFERDLPTNIPISIWPSGIETDLWIASPERNKKKLKFLCYDKIRWERKKHEIELLKPILEELNLQGIEIEYVRYGHYKEQDFKEKLNEVDAMIFLCEHETQGFAYLQTLSTNTPIFAWDRKGYWQDPTLYPDKIKFEPVTSVPYWASICGEKFTGIEEFKKKLNIFLQKIREKKYQPRKFIMENFTLATRSASYAEKVVKIMNKT